MANAAEVTVSGTVWRRIRRIPAGLLMGLVVGYQRWVSPLLGPRCRFYPSCSAYAWESLRVHGAVKGIALSAWRVGRCHPWNPGGVDHVPAYGSWRAEPYVSLEDLTCWESPTPGSSQTRPSTDDRSAA